MFSILIEDPDSRARLSHPVRIGVPFPRGLLFDPERVTVTGEAEVTVAHQARPLSYWPDRSIRWLLLRMSISKDQRPSVSLSVQISTKVASSDSGARTPLLDHREGCWHVDTGKMNCSIPERGSALVEGIELVAIEGVVSRSIRVQLVDDDGIAFRANVTDLEIRENGPISAAIQVRGTFGNSRHVAPVRFEALLDFWIGQPRVYMELDLWNPRAACHKGNLWDLGDPGAFLFSDCSVEVSCPLAIERVVWRSSPESELSSYTGHHWVLYQDSSGGANWQSKNHVDAKGRLTVSIPGYEVRTGHDRSVEETGRRSDPAVRFYSGDVWVSSQVERFWENFPNALRCASNVVSIALFPNECASSFELQGGERKRHYLSVGFGDASGDGQDESSRSSLTAVIDRRWIASTGVVPCFCSVEAGKQDSRMEAYRQSIIEGELSFEKKREIIDEYGWRNFGELYADHEAVDHSGPGEFISHYNNQYDFLLAAAVHFMRTGDSSWKKLLEEGARHYIDIDIYHTAEDRPAYNNGVFWHTDHYKDAGTSTHRTYSRLNKSGRHYGGGPSNEHNYTTGLLYYYFLSGDESAKDAILRIADWVIAMDDGKLSLLGLLSARPTGHASSTVTSNYHGPGRGAGNSINALLDAHELSGRRDYLTKAEELLVRCIHPYDDVEARRLDDPELRWSYLVFLQVLGKFLDHKFLLGETDYYFFFARDSLIHYGRWMANHEMPYADMLDKVEHPTETWPAQDIRKCHVMHLVSRICPPDEIETYRTKAKYFYEHCISGVLAFSSAHLTRPRVILAVFGHVHAYFSIDDLAETSPGDYRKDHGYKFGRPEQFLPQRATLFADIQEKRRVVTNALRRALCRCPAPWLRRFWQ